MKFLSAVLAPLLLGGLLAGQEPNLVWEGQVDGVVTLLVRGDRLKVREESGVPVQYPYHRFSRQLPDRRQNVDVRVVEGRGRVWVVEQPNIENNYTLVVGIDDRQPGAALYALEFYWGDGEALRDPFDPKGKKKDRDDEQVSWSGRVDGEVLVRCAGTTCQSEARSGQPVGRERIRVRRVMPSSPFLATLENAKGRGEIRLIEQPSHQNGYTAVVLISDPESGASNYSFSLAWRRASGFDLGSGITTRGLTWSGQVDGQVRVIVQGREAKLDVVTGNPVSMESAIFERELPAAETLNVSLRKRRGRGSVEIIEYPSSRNGYRLIFEIRDSASGADHYEIEVSW